MKNLVLAFAIVSITISCGNKKEKKSDDFISTDEVVEETHSGNPEIGGAFKKGADLIASNDCLSCHKVDEKLVGPSYQDVANKYSSADENKLINNIIKGCEGNWGDIPMVAHPDLPKEDVSEMVKYILSLKK